VKIVYGESNWYKAYEYVDGKRTVDKQVNDEESRRTDKMKTYQSHAY
jgi:hypothetical protein